MADDAYETFEALRVRGVNKTILDGPYGRAWQRVFGTVADVQLGRLRDAVSASWPTYAPEDALTYIADERDLERLGVLPSGTPEALAVYRPRLRAAWRIWRRGGSAEGVVEALSWMAVAARVLRRQDYAPPPTAGTPYVRTFARMAWAQFDLLTGATPDLGLLKWGDFAWGDGSTWGTTLSVDDIASMRRLIRRHKAAHETCTYLHVTESTGAIWGTFQWGDGTVYGGEAGDTTTLVIGEKHWETRGLTT